MITVKDRFEHYVGLAFPTVKKGSTQYEVLELMWFSASYSMVSDLLDPNVSLDASAKRAIDMLNETSQWCKEFNEKMKSQMKPATAGDVIH